ncbi:MAG: EamA family transporter, partial [Ruminococcus sp.]|nr:EamA family transporter [Ruminococcus sp.]
MNRKQASLLLAMVFMARGTSFLFSKSLMNTMSPMCVLAVRFILAFVILAVLFHKRLFACSRRSLLGGVILGVLYTVCMAFEMFGLKLIDTGISALIENMAIVVVPIIVAVLTRGMPKIKTIICAVMAVIGVGFLSITQSKVSGGFLGILLTVLAALTYAVCIIVTEKVSRDADPLAIGVIQIGVMGALSLLVVVP